MEIPQLLVDKVFDVPGVRVVQVSQLLEVTLVIPEFQLVEKIRTCSWTMSTTCPLVCNNWWSMSRLRLSTWGPRQFLDKVVDMTVGVSTSAWFRLCRENCGVSAVAAHRQGLGAEVDELRGGFFRALYIGTGPGAVSTGTRPA